MHPTRLVVVGVVSVLALEGCSPSAFLRGATFADGDLKTEATASFKTDACGYIVGGDRAKVIKARSIDPATAPAPARVPPPQTITTSRFGTIAPVGCGPSGRYTCYGTIVTTSTVVEPPSDKEPALPSPGTLNTYHLVKRGTKLALYERPSTAATAKPPYAGIVITNHWTADDGEHYFNWAESHQQGWEFIIPTQPGARGERLIYWHTGSTTAPDGGDRPSGLPVAKCDLVRVD